MEKLKVKTGQPPLKADGMHNEKSKAAIIKDPLVIGGEIFYSRLFLGTGKYGDLANMEAAIEASGTSMVTVALRRMDILKPGAAENRRSLLDYIPKEVRCQDANYALNILPNTSGARTAKEAVLAAELAREILQTNFVKLELHPDPVHLMPDPIETFAAAELLVKKGFIVLPYVHADPVLCKRLEEVGVAAVMPLGAPIGSNLGLKSSAFLEIIIDNATVPVIIDAGIGRPSDAALALEMGADAVLVSTAVATAKDPVNMAAAFKMAVVAGRVAYLAGLGSSGSLGASTSPLTAFLAQ